MAWLCWLAWVVCAHAALPLAEVRFDAVVAGSVAEVTVRQTFVNTSGGDLEAVYVFPLHEGAGVDHMAMTVGDRRIVAQLVERQQAEQTYVRAVQRGQTAALTRSERANLFTQHVGAIPAGARVQVELRVVQPVEAGSGGGQLVLPLVAAPRFVAPGREGEPGPRWVLGDGRPLEASVDVAVEGLSPEAVVEVSTHDTLQVEANGRVTGVAAMDRDLVVRWQQPSVRPTARLLIQGDHGQLLLEPPAVVDPTQRVPREWVFVVDTSCSMSGAPMDLARRALLALLDRASEHDRWQLLTFGEALSGPTHSQPLTWSRRTHERGRIWNLQAQGGTYLLDGVLAALRSEGAPNAQRVVVFVTDGLVGEEAPVLQAIAQEVGRARLYALGVGPAPHRWLLEEMAAIGGGHTDWVRRGESPEDTVARFVAGLDAPLLTDVSVDWADWVVDQQVPQRMPTLHAGRAVALSFRVRRRGSQPIHVQGTLGQRAYALQVPATELPSGRALRVSWARGHIAAMERAGAVWGDLDALEPQIRAMSLQEGVLSRHTAFVAVDERSRTAEPVYEMVVVASPDAVDTASTSRGAVLTKEYLNRIPAGRSYQAAVQLSPGVSGGPPLRGHYLLDGASVTDPVTGTCSVSVPAAAVEQVELITAGVPAHLAGAAGVVQLEPRHGTNRLRHDLRVGHEARLEGGLQATTVDGTVSGPVVRDRAWVLGSVASSVSDLGDRAYEGQSAYVDLTVQPDPEWRGSVRVAVERSTVEEEDRRLATDGQWPAARLQWFVSPQVEARVDLSAGSTTVGGDRRARQSARAEVLLHEVRGPMDARHDVRVGAEASSLQWTLSGSWAEEWLGVSVDRLGAVPSGVLFASDAVDGGRWGAELGLRSQATLGRWHHGPRGALWLDPWGDQRTQLLVGAGRRHGLLGLAVAALEPAAGLPTVDEVQGRAQRELVRDLAVELGATHRLHRGVPAFGGGRDDVAITMVSAGLRKLYSRRWMLSLAGERAWAPDDERVLIDDGSLVGFAWAADGSLAWVLPVDPNPLSVGLAGAWRVDPLGTWVPAVERGVSARLPRWMVGVQLEQRVALRKGGLDLGLSVSRWSLRTEAPAARWVSAQQAVPLTAAGDGLRVEGSVAYRF
jgi:Ca-activated chloride channel family protein